MAPFDPARFGSKGGAILLHAGAAALALAPLAAPAPAAAANAITGGCTASSTGIVFPNYDLLAKPQQTANGTVSVQCTGTGTVTVNVALSAGGGTCATRKMTSGASAFSYNLYTTAAFATIWCDPTTRVATTFSFQSQTTPSTLTNPVTMFGKVPTAQTVPVANYTDTVAATVFWTGGNSAASNFTATENAPATCTASVGSLGFGNYTGIASSASASLTITCTSGTAYTIALGAGANLSGTRRMKSAAGKFIAYNLYHDAGFTSLWGDGTALGTATSASGSGSAQAYTAFGRTVAAAAPVPGSYADSVVVTVSY